MALRGTYIFFLSIPVMKGSKGRIIPEIALIDHGNNFGIFAPKQSPYLTVS